MKRIAICLSVLGPLLLSSLNANAQNVRGDVNQDGQVNISDVTELIDYLLRGSWGDIPVTQEEWKKVVDLGLPSGTLWATKNIGANYSYHYGSFFAWGETEPKEIYKWLYYKWCYGSSITLTKYCTDRYYGYNNFTDDKTELDVEDDAAYVNWGPSWRMPSKEQLQELIDECTWTTSEDYDENDLLLTGPNGNTLVFPATGYHKDSYHNGKGAFGKFWSRSLRSDAFSYCLKTDSSGAKLDYEDRSYGLTVRAVHVFQVGWKRADVNQDEQVNISDVTELIDFLLRGSWGDEPVTPEEPEHEYVDLGLPSGTLWATTNLPGYFAWGETSPTEQYNWYYYKWCKGENKTFTKYCTNREYGYKGFTDGKDDLDPEDDAAYVNWGPSWRMPTISQWNELINKCTWEWTGSGQLVTGPNGNTIYLSANGYCGDELCLGEGEIGEYWSRSLYYVYGMCDCAYTLSFVKGNINPYGNWYPRCGGLKIRAVRASQN